jgi:hypothetical protein
MSGHTLSTRTFQLHISTDEQNYSYRQKQNRRIHFNGFTYFKI